MLAARSSFQQHLQRALQVLGDLGFSGVMRGAVNDDDGSSSELRVARAKSLGYHHCILENLSCCSSRKVRGAQLLVSFVVVSLASFINGA